MLVYKVALTEPTNDLVLPKHAKLLSVQLQKDVFTLWYSFNAGDEDTVRRIVFLGTGNSYPSKYLMHIDTVQKNEFVWHFFEDMGYVAVS